MELTAAQIAALKDGRPVTVTPPELGERCVVLREDVYARVRAAADRPPIALPHPGARWYTSTAC